MMRKLLHNSLCLIALLMISQGAVVAQTAPITPPKSDEPLPPKEQSTAFFEDLKDSFTLDWIDSHLEQERWKKVSAEGNVVVRSEGRVHEGRNQYRKVYKKKPPGMQVWSRSGATEAEFKTLAAQLQSRGYILMWAQTFEDLERVARYQGIWVRVAWDAQENNGE